MNADVTVFTFEKKKKERQPIVMVTAYDTPSARLVEKTSIDAILVGDSVAMVVHGHPSTLAATPQMMALHTAAVARGTRTKFIVADMPFLSFRKGVPAAMECVDLLMKAGAHAVKLEGLDGHEEVVRAISESGVPVMGHLGLTPQSVHQMGGYRVQGRGDGAASRLFDQALKLQELGCFSIVLECVPHTLAQKISRELRIPTIGIGAGHETDGQVLVWHDLLGIQSELHPIFVRRFGTVGDSVATALEQYAVAARERGFPSAQESYE